MHSRCSKEAFGDTKTSQIAQVKHWGKIYTSSEPAKLILNLKGMGTFPSPTRGHVTAILIKPIPICHLDPYSIDTSLRSTYSSSTKALQHMGLVVEPRLSWNDPRYGCNHQVYSYVWTKLKVN